MTESFKELFEQSIIGAQFYPGAIISAKVIDIDDDFVTLNAGLKSEGIISIDEFRDKDGAVEVHLGDMVEVALDSVEDGFGETILSREKAKRQEAWRRLSKSHENNETVIGLISGKVKGGFTVEIGSIRAFLPGSLVDVRPVRDPSYLEGKEFEFKVIKMDLKRNNIVVSRRAVVEEENSADRHALLASLHDGQVLTGVVKNLTDYGAFIDLGGIDGLLHITDISWKRVKHPSELLSVGQDIKVKVLSFDNERNRVSLGMKQCVGNPWQQFSQAHGKGEKVSGKIRSITDFGIFIGLDGEIDGLVHLSDISWTVAGEEAVKQYKKGQELEAVILAIDSDRERISLGIKQLDADNFTKYIEEFAKGSVVQGKVTEVDAKLVTLELAEEVIGTIRSTELADEKVEDATTLYKVGDEIEAKITTIDKKNRTIALSVKAKDAHDQAETLKKYSRGGSEGVSTTLGDLLKEKMANNNKDSE